MGHLRVMDKTGDTKHEWDPSKPAEVEVAREVFTTYKAQGFAAAHIAPYIGWEIIHEFDPAAGEILFIPQMAGG
jgi:hypothetical protein